MMRLNAVPAVACLSQQFLTAWPLGGRREAFHSGEDSSRCATSCVSEGPSIAVDDGIQLGHAQVGERERFCSRWCVHEGIPMLCEKL